MSRKHPLFTSVESCKEFLLDEGFITDHKSCIVCGNTSKIIIYKERGKTGILYRCQSRECQAKSSLLIVAIKMPLDDFFYILYLVICNAIYELINDLTGCSGSTISRVKSYIRRYFKDSNDENLLIGGPSVEVEVDETVYADEV